LYMVKLKCNEMELMFMWLLNKYGRSVAFYTALFYIFSLNNLL
jgi:hypothetical protein